MAENAANEGVWLDANRYYDAEARFHAERFQVSVAESNKRANPGSPVAANQMTDGGDGVERFENNQKQIETILKQLTKLTSDMNDVLSRVSTIEKFMKTLKPQNNEIKASVKNETKTTIQNGSSNAAGDDDDLDLFGSDEEDDAEAAKLKEERLQAYANKKAKKPALVAKSSVVLDVKPWDDETDMKEMEKAVRAVETDGLVWGASKLVPLAYGINKLQIVAIVEDEKVSIDWLQEKISENEDLVQSVDIAAFNKL